MTTRAAARVWTGVALPSALAAAVLLSPASPAAAVAGGCDPAFEIVDHRGAHDLQDENTLPAIVAGARRGESVELDVRVTSDGRTLLMHDAKFDRTTNGTGLVAETTFAQARSYVTEPGGETVPTLLEALRTARPYDVDVYLDVKSSEHDLLALTAQLIRRTGMVDSALVTTRNKEMTRVAPDIHLQWKPEGPAPTLEEVVDRGVESLSLFPPQMSHELVDGARVAGVEVHSRLVSDRAGFDAATQYQIQGALTNTPIRLGDYCAGTA